MKKKKKKIFLTEEQMRLIQTKQMLNESFIKNFYKDCETFEDYFKMTCVLLSMGLGTVGLGLFVIESFFPKEFEQNKKEISATFQRYAEEGKENKEQKNFSFDKERDDLYQQRVKEINNLMKYVAELNGRDPKKIKLSAENIVSLCDKYNFPIPLLLAQAHLESHFGMTPRALKTNSVFSIGSYDDGRNIYRPSTQDESVENYILTIKKYYLADKTLDELLSNGGFVNHRGHRYASDKKYEQKIRQTMNGLIKTYCPSCF